MAPTTPTAHTPMPRQTPSSYAARLLERSHSPATAAALQTDKLKHKPLILHAPATAPRPTITTTTTSSTGTTTARTKAPPKDARILRREARNAKLEAQGRRRPSGKSKRPRPLSAAEKRRLCLYDIPKGERKYSVYEGLHALWCAYMREVLLGPSPSGGNSGSMGSDANTSTAGSRPAYLTPQGAGPLLVSADYHGAELEVVRSRCVSRVGVRGIVVRDTKFTFEVVTRRDEIKTLPKEHSIFRFKVPRTGPRLDDQVDGKVGKEEGEAGTDDADCFVFELHGDHFQYRATDRANKKFKVHVSPDL